MKRSYLLLVVGCLVLQACSEPEGALPMDPDLAATKPPAPSSNACDFDALGKLINDFFPPPDQQTAQGFAGAMETSTKWTAGAVTNGFAIMDLVGKASRSYAPSPTVGSDLTKALTKCMFDADQDEYKDLAGGQGVDALEFNKALDAPAGGVYYVVGEGYDVPNVPQTLKGTVSGFGRLSAVAPGPVVFTSPGPDPTFTLGSWATAMSDNTANNQGQRALIYGYPVSFGPLVTSPVVFEWATIAPFTSFKDHAIVSICDGQSAQDLMVHETGIGVLAYTDANLCGLPDATGITPKTGFRSQLSNTPVAINVEWISVPRSPLRVGPANVYEFVARATTMVEGQTEPQGVNNVCLTLTGTNNNGQGTDLVNVGGGECPGQTDNTDNVVTAVTDSDPDHDMQAGYATFRYYIDKNGALILTLDSEGVPGRQVGDAVPVMLRYNVKP
ncbi:MAG: hypothetical protein ACREMH_11685 [Gemmatimonadales bacterium]